MPSPMSFAISRQAPPVRPSRSLEGMERVVPPESPARPSLKLDKPLPDLPSKPLPATPSMEASTAWSDDSSLADSFESRRPSNASTGSYPVVVRSPSDDLAELVDHSSAANLDRSSPVEPFVKPRPAPLTFAAVSQDRYQSSQPWTPNRSRPNHYFREKKWDFFPELAIPSELPPKSPKFPSKQRKKDASRLNLGTFDFSKKGNRWNSTERSGLTLAHDMRKSIRSYVQQRISKHSVDKEKAKRARPATAPSEYVQKCHPTPRVPSSNYSDDESIAFQNNDIDSTEKLTRLSMSTTSSAEERVKPLKPVAFQRRKQLAVPMSPYQKYGAAIWEKSGREKRISYRQSQNVRFPRYQKSPSSPKPEATNTTPPLSPPPRSPAQQIPRDYMKALQGGTSQVLVAAKQKMTGARVDRKRMELKSQIRLVGPVSPQNSYEREGVDPWI
ncbi:hypothetical protein P170DRAFT_472562 [Aspergillus steynii IBT 23096]|uniref:Uncharacterized protein n=1 Tax=Aspergillus steynii IBT 23096 TaxID=1392250 RepID=A0A2I2GIG5_9EURO|nr:uncharacterized protein P170DRAFT_472562 [Aspergillus steynii IBT 23096]PLB52671.1 hypothetical protein P170DRAFT_472562 [Aspergillus steynii IBT 23096]